MNYSILKKLRNVFDDGYKIKVFTYNVTYNDCGFNYVTTIDRFTEFEEIDRLIHNKSNQFFILDSNGFVHWEKEIVF